MALDAVDATGQVRCLCVGVSGLFEVDHHPHTLGDMSIRSGGRDDLDAVFGLECASFSQDRISRRALRRFLDSDLKPVIVARFGDSLAGYALVVTRRGARAARIYTIAVDQRHLRRGVGRELLRACERYARMRGCSALRLEVRWDNAPAIALYERLGYRRFGIYPSYYEDGAEALRLEKSLEAREVEAA